MSIRLNFQTVIFCYVKYITICSIQTKVAFLRVWKASEIQKNLNSEGMPHSIQIEQNGTIFIPIIL